MIAVWWNWGDRAQTRKPTFTPALKRDEMFDACVSLVSILLQAPEVSGRQLRLGVTLGAIIVVTNDF